MHTNHIYYANKILWNASPVLSDCAKDTIMNKWRIGEIEEKNGIKYKFRCQ